MFYYINEDLRPSHVKFALIHTPVFFTHNQFKMSLFIQLFVLFFWFPHTWYCISHRYIYFLSSSSVTHLLKETRGYSNFFSVITHGLLQINVFSFLFFYSIAVLLQRPVVSPHVMEWKVRHNFVCHMLTCSRACWVNINTSTRLLLSPISSASKYAMGDR